jgi:cell division protein FtsL
MATSAAPRGEPRQARPARGAGQRPTTIGRHLRAVPAPRTRRRRAPFLFLAVVLVGGLVLGVASLQALVAQTSFRMEDLGRRGAVLRQEQGELRLEVAQLSAPRRIANEARRLGLRLPDPAEVKTLEVKAGPGHGSP